MGKGDMLLCSLSGWMFGMSYNFLVTCREDVKRAFFALAWIYIHVAGYGTTFYFPIRTNCSLSEQCLDFKGFFQQLKCSTSQSISVVLLWERLGLGKFSWLYVTKPVARMVVWSKRKFNYLFSVPFLKWRIVLDRTQEAVMTWHWALWEIV